MGIKTLLSECFLNRGFTLLQWFLNLVLQFPHFTLNINGQYNTAPTVVSQHDYMLDYLHFLICTYLFFPPSYDLAPLVIHRNFTIQSQLSFLRSEILYDRWITVKMKKLHSLVDISMPCCVSLAWPWHPSLPQTVSWQSTCSWLLKHHSAVSVLLVYGMMGEAISYIWPVMLKGFPQCTQLELLHWCAVLTKIFDQSRPWHV